MRPTAWWRQPGMLAKGPTGRWLPWLVALGLAAPLLWTLPADGVYVGNGTDLYSYQIPLRTFAGRALADGSWPGWNPYLLGGVPAHAGAQLGLAYPPDLLVQPWAGPEASALLMGLHLVLLAAGAFALGAAHVGRPSLRAPTLPGLLAALVLAGGGPAWGHVFAGHVSFVQALAWLPWLWALALRALQRRSPGHALLAAAALGLQVLAGHPQVSYLTLVGLVPLLLAHVVDPVAVPPADDRPPTGLLARLPGSLAALLVLATLGVGAAALSAVQWLPSLWLAPALNRSLATPLEIATAFSAPAATLLTTWAPDVWGGARGSVAAFSYHETVAFVGAAGSALALVGLAVGGLRAWLLGAAAVLFALLSLGSHGPLLADLVDLVPGLGSFRVPGRWVLPAVACVALLAAQGLQALLDGARSPGSARKSAVIQADPWPAARRQAAWLLCAALALMVAWLAFGCRPDGGWWRQALGEARGQGVDLARASAAARGELWLAALALGAAAVASAFAAVRAQVALGLAVVAGLQALWFAGAHVGREQQRPVAGVAWTDEEAAVLQREVGTGQRLATAGGLRQANRGAAIGVRGAGGYEPAVTVAANRYGNLLAGRQADGLAVHFQVRRPTPWLTRLATSHLLHDGRDGRTARYFAAWPEVATLPSGRVLRRNPQPTPRLAVVDRIQVQPDARAAVLALASAPADVVLLSKALPHTPGTTATLAVVDDGLHRVEVRVRTPAPVVLVLRDAEAPGWQVEVDGRSADNALADGLFRAVAVPAGEHVVTWRFAVPGLQAGLATSALGWLAWLALGILWRRRVRS